MGNPLEWNERLTGQEDLQLFSFSAGYIYIYIYSQKEKFKKLHSHNSTKFFKTHF
jgi:hypothetical protein